MSTQSKLEQSAIAQRNILIARNTYNTVADSNKYGVTHTRALADPLTPVHGKGTGNYLDISNYNAGGEFDKNGNPEVSVGGGRNSAFANNVSTWGYGPNSYYKAPDTSLNSGQVRI